jgi:hypothetical protein
VPADQPDSAAGGMGFVARLVREKHPDATPLALPVLDGVVAKSSGNGSGAANGAGGSNGSPSSSTGSANGSSNGSANGSANGASSGSASASGNGAGDDLTGAAAPRRPDGQDDGTEIRRVNLPDDASVDLVTLRDGRARSARDVVASLGAMAARYDVVLVDLPAVDTSALAPALLQGAGEVLAVVARGSAEHAVDELRRTTRIFSTPIRGCIFTQTHR